MSVDEWILSHLISNASAMKSTTKGHKSVTYTSPTSQVKIFRGLTSAQRSIDGRRIERGKKKEGGKLSSHHAPSRSVRKKIRQPVDNNSNNRRDASIKKLKKKKKDKENEIKRETKEKRAKTEEIFLGK